MSPVGIIFVPFSPKTGTNFLPYVMTIHIVYRSLLSLYHIIIGKIPVTYRGFSDVLKLMISSVNWDFGGIVSRKTLRP